MSISRALAAVSLLGLFGVTAPANAADVVAPEQGLIFGGLIGVEGGWRWYESSDIDEKDDGFQFNVDGRLNIPLAENFSIQLTGQGEFYEDVFDNLDTQSSTEAHALGGHISWRDPNSFLIGAFGALALAGEDADEHVSSGYLVGGEAQLYLDNLTLYAQVGIADIDTDRGEIEGFVKGWFVRGVGRYFFTEDFMIQGDVSYGETSEYVDSHDDGEIWNAGAEVKLRLLDEIPLYGSLAYEYGEYDATTEIDVSETHAILGGLAFLFGAETLLQNDRYGATLDLPMLPSRAASFAEDLD